MAVGSLSLLLLFVFPLWRIILVAPQYPHGVHMFIHIDKIGGSEPGTLQNVNILNHYIGMKPIVPESIPELSFLPIIVVVFAALGMIAVFIDKKWAYMTWLIIFVLACIAGMYDFYLWEYDYGHDLADNAPMKFDDQSFQPPLIGRKNIINFIAYSWPHVGGFIAMGAIVFAALATYLKIKEK